MSYGLIKILMIDQGTFLSTYKHRRYILQDIATQVYHKKQNVLSLLGAL